MPHYRATLSKLSTENSHIYKCGHYLKHKLPGKGQGLLPRRETEIIWEKVAIDLIDPCTIKENRNMCELNGLT